MLVVGSPAGYVSVNLVPGRPKYSMVCVGQMIISSFVAVDVTGPSVGGGGASVVVVSVGVSGSVVYPQLPSLLWTGSQTSEVPDVQMHELGPCGSCLYALLDGS